MDIRNVILRLLEKKQEIKTSDIVHITGFSRAYIGKVLQCLREEGTLMLLGKANQAKYILATEKSVKQHRSKILKFRQIFDNKNLLEDKVLDSIRNSTGIFDQLSDNISNIVGYGFTEMLNNAIDHSRSSKVEVKVELFGELLRFEIIDKGIGIYNNIMKQKHLKTPLEAIQDLLKGKQTTMPAGHSGEGIFFTSKCADMLIIKSSKKKLIFNNLLKDIFIRDIKGTVGTKVNFSISTNSTKQVDTIFKEYTDSSFEFDKTEVKIRLYKGGTEYISRSQARRILSGLDKFKTILFDFKSIETIGQGFADEIFRVWKAKNPKAKIITKNANQNIKFMIDRVLNSNVV